MTNPSPTAREGLRWLLFWLGVWTAFGVFDYWRNEKHDGSTFSEITRLIFRTHTEEGAKTFSTTLGFAKDVFEAHILKQPFH